MCGRFALTAPASTITEIFEIDILPDVLPRYNIAPTQKVAVIVQEEGERKLDQYRWGLVPFWAKDPKIGARMINARGETVSSKPAFRAAFKRRRVLIPATGFYEWTRLDKKTKLPHLISMADGRPFAMAGLWERWKDAEGNEMRSTAIITTGPNELMEPIHNRMPVILPPSAWDAWLDPSNDDKETLSELLVPAPSDAMKTRRVSRTVNNVRNQGEACQGPPEDEQG
jgi:putative SOS response-associated peptidase YedK